jgi:hypothetical protein
MAISRSSSARMEWNAGIFVADPPLFRHKVRNSAAAALPPFGPTLRIGPNVVLPSGVSILTGWTGSTQGTGLRAATGPMGSRTFPQAAR